MWNEERFSAAVRYREQGMSAKEIADRLGEGLTRNGVLGKFHRAGLAKTQGDEVLRAQLQRRRQRARAAKEAAAAAAPKPGPVVAKPAPAPRIDIDSHTLDIPRVLSLLELESTQCKWPIGTDPLEGFCGCQAVEGKSYCPGHSARAYTAPRASIPGARMSYQLKVRVVGNSTRWG